MLALVSDGYGAQGGIARYNQDLFSALYECDIFEEINIIPRNGNNTQKLPEAIKQAPPSKHKLSWLLAVVNAALSAQYEVIYCGHINYLPAASMIAYLSSAKIWLQVYGIEVWNPQKSISYGQIKNVDLVTAASRYTRQKFLELYPIVPEKTRVIPPTFSPRFRRNSKKGDFHIPEKLEGKKIILTVARLDSRERYKGHDKIIELLPELSRQVSGLAYLIIGSGDDQNRLEKLCVEIGVASQVIFMNNVSDEDMPKYFALADVFAMPSVGEGFGIVFLEAAAAGLPVVGGNKDGSIDALLNGIIGAAVDPEVPSEIFDALLDALSGRLVAAPEAVIRFNLSNFQRHVSLVVQDALLEH
jgi:phosphatidylinositol alpha-1,6-mannosyltransferase